MIEYGARHYAYQRVDHEFDTLHEAVEWVSEREEPDEYRDGMREQAAEAINALVGED